MEPAVVYGYWPCFSEGNDVVVLDTENRTDEIARFSFPRQQRDRFLCLADFFHPKESGELDVIGFHLVTMGERVSEVTGELFAANAYRDYLELHGLSVQLTEALAEYWHARVRSELGFAGEDSDDMNEVFRQGYRGSRYSFGYPACPDLEDRATLVRLLRPERIGVKLSEELQLHPEQSTDALVVHHPEAKYFNATMSDSDLDHRLQAVLFDMDGTLCETEPAWMNAERAMAAEYGATWTHEDGLALVGNNLIDSGRLHQAPDEPRAEPGGRGRGAGRPRRDRAGRARHRVAARCGRAADRVQRGRSADRARHDVVRPLRRRGREGAPAGPLRRGRDGGVGREGQAASGRLPDGGRPARGRRLRRPSRSRTRRPGRRRPRRPDAASWWCPTTSRCP